MSTKQLIESGRLNQVVVATDGSDFSSGAIRVGVALSNRAQATVVGLSISLYSPEYTTLVPNLQEDSAARAKEALNTFIGEAGPEARTLIHEASDPAQGIVEGAEGADADLIVMGRRGKRGLARTMVGDATVKVIGRASCPVLVVPKAAQLWQHHILLATDGSEYSEAAASVAGFLARQAGLPVTVVSVVTSSHSEARRQEAERAVNSKVERLREMALTVQGQVVEGRPDEAIVKAAEAVGADLIVMGSHGRTGLTKILMGSVSERVIGQAACPVLVVKP